MDKIIGTLNNRYLVAAVVLLFLVIPLVRRFAR